jgi:hypothetical protein
VARRKAGERKVHPPVHKNHKPYTNPEPTISYCAPSRYDNFKASGTCLRREELVQLARLYNRTLDDGSWKSFLFQSFSNVAKAEIARARIDESADDIFDQLKARLGDDDYAWLELPWVRKARGVYDALEDAFRPKLPKTWKSNDHQWLNTDDINMVMQQYVDKFTDFHFLGVFPIDFDTKTFFGNCIANEMCNLSVQALKREGKRHFGAVLNLDRHDESGSHWVSVYGNLDLAALNYGVHYYDSVGRTPPPEVTTFMKRIAGQMTDANVRGHASIGGSKTKKKDNTHKSTGGPVREAPCTHNRVRRQFKNTECGIFAMYYLVCCMSESIPIDDVWKAMGDDDIIHKLRYVFYRPSDAESREASLQKWFDGNPSKLADKVKKLNRYTGMKS